MPGDFSYLEDKKYISLETFRKSGAAVATPVWFAMQGGKLAFMSRDDSGKLKRIRNNPQVRLAPCTMRGKVTGPAVSGKARVLSGEEAAAARAALERKYWLMRVPFLWSKKNVFVEISA